MGYKDSLLGKSKNTRVIHYSSNKFWLCGRVIKHQGQSYTFRLHQQLGTVLFQQEFPSPEEDSWTSWRRKTWGDHAEAYFNSFFLRPSSTFICCIPNWGLRYPCWIFEVLNGKVPFLSKTHKKFSLLPPGRSLK